jgi:hypothetical protein
MHKSRLLYVILTPIGLSEKSFDYFYAPENTHYGHSIIAHNCRNHEPGRLAGQKGSVFSVQCSKL